MPLPYPSRLGSALAALALLLCSYALLPATRASAQQPFYCPPELLSHPRKCEKLARRHEREEQLWSYRQAHPWRISALAQGSLFMLGLGNSNVAGFWGVGLGASAVHELTDRLAVRIDALGRLGHGNISNWGFGGNTDLQANAGYLGGAELHTSLLIRLRSVYLGPVLSVGLLHLRAQTVQASSEGRYIISTISARVPSDAPFLATGFVLGWELTPGGQVGANVRFTPGIWNDLEHFFCDLSLNVSVKLWD